MVEKQKDSIQVLREILNNDILIKQYHHKEYVYTPLTSNAVDADYRIFCSQNFTHC